MIIPVRCFTCAKVIASKWEIYQKMLKDGISASEALDKIGFKRYCCRRMFLTHVDLIDEFLKYPKPNNLIISN